MFTAKGRNIYVNDQKDWQYFNFKIFLKKLREIQIENL